TPTDEEGASIFEGEQRVSGGHPSAVGDQTASGARADVSSPRREALKSVVNLRRATRLSQELCPRPDQSPRRNGEHHPQPSRAVVDHIMELAAPRREHLGNRAEILLGQVEVKPFDRLAQLPIYHPTHHLGLA